MATNYYIHGNFNSTNNKNDYSYLNKIKKYSRQNNFCRKYFIVFCKSFCIMSISVPIQWQKRKLFLEQTKLHKSYGNCNSVL